MLVLGIDPGLTNGVALVETNPYGVVFMDQVSFTDLNGWLDTVQVPDQVVIEDFRIRYEKAMAFAGSRMETIQAIGMVERWAHEKRVPIHRQVPSDRLIGSKWTGMREPKNHAQSHFVSAFNHAIYWCVAKQQIKLQTLLLAKKKTRP